MLLFLKKGASSSTVLNLACQITVSPHLVPMDAIERGLKRAVSSAGGRGAQCRLCSVPHVLFEHLKAFRGLGLAGMGTQHPLWLSLRSHKELTLLAITPHAELKQTRTWPGVHWGHRDADRSGAAVLGPSLLWPRLLFWDMGCAPTSGQQRRGVALQEVTVASTPFQAPPGRKRDDDDEKAGPSKRQKVQPGP